MTTCGLNREDEEEDIDFMVRCKVAETNTCLATVVADVIEHHEEESELEEDGGGDGW